MPIIKSAKKRVKVANKAAVRNSKTKRSLKTAIKAFGKALTGKDAGKALSKAQSEVDKAAKKGVVHKNKAARKKSQLAKAAKASAGVTKKAAAPKAAAKKAPVKKAAPKKAVAAKKPAVKKAAPKKKSARKPNAAFMAPLTPSATLSEVIGSKAVPLEGLEEGLGQTLPMVIHRSEVKLGGGTMLLCRSTYPFRCFSVIPRHALSIGVERSDSDLGKRVAVLGQSSPNPQSCREVAFLICRSSVLERT